MIVKKVRDIYKCKNSGIDVKIEKIGLNAVFMDGYIEPKITFSIPNSKRPHDTKTMTEDEFNSMYVGKFERSK